LKEIRTKVGKFFGDEVEVTIEEADEPRVVKVTPDVDQALKTSAS
jgi:hypothetical protein